MSRDSTVEKIIINVDGKEVEVPSGLNAIEAARLHGKEIPHYCYHPKLSVAGNCRMCLIEVGMPMRDRTTGEPIIDESGKQKIGWIPKPTIGCATNVTPGIHLKTDSPMVKEARNGVTEFLLINHPLDCPICDQAGECRLQEFSADHGRGKSRFIEEKNVKPKHTVLGPRVTLDDERCILCSRCIRFSKEIAGDDCLGFTDRGTYSTLTCYPGKELKHNYSLNTVDICPVGALTSTDFRFKMRVWFLKRTNSICTESSVGSNTTIWSREGKIYRITPRRNDAVNDTWMTDSGRELFKAIETDDRLTHYTVDGIHKTLDETAIAASNLLQGGKVAIVASAHSSVEEQFFYRLIAEQTNASVELVCKTGVGDGILLTEDRTPNLRGALLTGLISELPSTDFSTLKEQINLGTVKTLVVMNEDVTTLGLPEEVLSKVRLLYFGTHANETSRVAEVVCPSLSVFEKEGTFVNVSFRVQRFSAAVPGPEGILPDVVVLEKILAALTGEESREITQEILWEQLSSKISQFAGLTWSSIGDEGVAIDPSAFLHLPFSETRHLNFDPIAFKETQAALFGA